MIESRSYIVTAMMEDNAYVWDSNGWIPRPTAHGLIRRFTQAEARSIRNNCIIHNAQLDPEERIDPQIEYKPS